MIGTGCRFGEVIALKWSDIDFENNQILIERSFDHVESKKLTKTKKAIYTSSEFTYAVSYCFF